MYIPTLTTTRAAYPITSWSILPVLLWTTNTVSDFELLYVRFHYCYKRKYQTKATRQDPYTNDEQINDVTPCADVIKMKNDVKKTREN